MVLVVVVLLVVTGSMSYQAGKKAGMSGRHQEVNTGDHSAMSMKQMTEGLQGLQGDAFDKAFVEMMIAHHQGAVDMAELIPAQAKHAELKKLGIDIIIAQTKEIEMMKQWLSDWGYQESQSMDHSMMDH